VYKINFSLGTKFDTRHVSQILHVSADILLHLRRTKVLDLIV